MTTGPATEAAAALPAIEETEEVWTEDDATETLPADSNVSVEDPEAEEDAAAPGTETAADREAAAKERADEATPEPTEEQQKAKAFDDLSASFSRDAVGYMRAMHTLLTPEQKAALDLREPAPPAPPTPNGEGWADEELTPPEKFVKANAAYIHDLPRFAQGVSRAVGTHEQVLIQHDNTIAALTAQVDALSAALGMALPKANLQGLDPGARQAYTAELKATAAKVRAARQGAETAVPKTPRNGGPAGADPSADLAPRGNESFTQLFRRVAAASRR
jgi:hypothetical protein